MKQLVIFVFLFLSSICNAQTYRGMLCDTSGRAINELAAIIVLNKKDSSSLYTKYIKEGIFNITPNLSDADSAVVYFSVYGYKDKVIDLPVGDTDFGNIELCPLIHKMDSVVVTATRSISYQMQRGKEHFEIPEVISQSHINLNSLLGEIPGLSYNGSSIEIIGKGSPIYLINGFRPRPGELSSIRAEDVEKVVVDKWPSARYDKSVKGIVNIITKTRKHDYLNGYVSNDFILQKYANNTFSTNINNRMGKWVNFLLYRHNYSQTSAELFYNTTLHGSQESHRINNSYQRNTGNTHTILLGPKYEIDKNSFIDLQYRYVNNGERANFSNDFSVVGSEVSDISSKSRFENETHNIALRYGNTFDKNKLLEISVAYSVVDKESSRDHHEYTTRLEDSAYKDITIKHDTDFDSKVFSAVANYDFPIGEKFTSETGAEYSRIWNNSTNDYHIEDAIKTKTSDHQASAYFNIGSSLGKFYLQLGFRGEYIYKIGSDGRHIDEKPFSFLPTVRLNYSITDKTYISLYYRRFTTHPTISERDPIMIYSNKYEYVQGNPNLKSSITDQFALDLKLPYNLSVSANLSNVKNDIFQVEDLYDEQKKITLLSYCNFNKHTTLNTTLSWSKRFDDIWFTYRYFASINIRRRQTWSDIQFLDDILNLNKPQYTFSTHHTIYWNLGINIMSFHIKGGYNTSCDYLTTIANDNWYLDAGIFLNLKKTGIKVSLNGFSLLYNDHEERSRYGKISSVNINRFPRRAYYFTISYSFNNHKPVFRANLSNADAVNRAN